MGTAPVTCERYLSFEGQNAAKRLYRHLNHQPNKHHQGKSARRLSRLDCSWTSEDRRDHTKEVTRCFVALPSFACPEQQA